MCLISKDRVLGVLQALNKTPSFSLDDKKLLEALSHQVAIAIENAKLYTDIKRNFYETVEAMAEAIEKKDRYTGGHTKRVVYYSMCIAKYLNLSPDELERIRLGAVLHDIGKIGIEDKILKKNAPLDKEEWVVMQEHPQIGFDIMNRVEDAGCDRRHEIPSRALGWKWISRKVSGRTNSTACSHYIRCGYVRCHGEHPALSQGVVGKDRV